MVMSTRKGRIWELAGIARRRNYDGIVLLINCICLLINCISRLIKSINRLIKGIHRLINGITRLINGVTRLINGWGAGRGPGAAIN